MANAAPERVVCLAPGYVETMIELGLVDRIVGVTTSSDYLEEVKDVEQVGLFMKPNIEKILSLKPDLVLATDFAGQKAAVDKLRSVGIRVTAAQAQKTEDITALVKELGVIFDIEERSDALLSRMAEVIEQTKAATKGLPKPRVYVEIGYDPLFTCGKESFIHDLIEIAGGTNIASELDQAFSRISSEFILSRDPEVIILPYMGRNFGKDSLGKRNGWKKVSAVRSGRIYDDIGSNIITIPSPRLILNGLPELLKRIHPELGERASEEYGGGNAGGDL
jgi:iron complex transport system substrate-binding protein